MSHTVTAHAEVLPDHTIVLRVPDDIPPGPVSVTLMIEPEDEPKIRTFKDLLESGFVGMYAGRDDLPETNEEFRAWRQKLWEGPDDPS